MRILLASAVAVAVFSAMVAVMAQLVPPPLGIDWRLTYRPAALALLRGENPYGADIAPQAPFFAAPWGLLPLLPFVFLPVEVGRVAIMLFGLIAFAYTAWRLKAKPVALVAFLLSPPVLHCIVNANIEWLPLVGFAMPPAIGLFFITVKPQTGFAVGFFWLIEAWRKGGWREVLRTFGPVTAAFGASLLLYGLWPLKVRMAIGIGAAFNSSLWPVSIPVGLALLVTAPEFTSWRWRQRSLVTTSSCVNGNGS